LFSIRLYIYFFLNYGLPDCEKYFPVEKCPGATLCMFELEIKRLIYLLIKGNSVDMVTSIYQTIRRHIPEDCNLNVYHNVTSNFYLLFAVLGVGVFGCLILMD